MPAINLLHEASTLLSKNAAREAKALASKIGKTDPHLLTEGKIIAGFESGASHGAPRITHQHLPKSPKLRHSEIDMFDGIAKGEITHPDMIHGGINHIGRMADIAPHLPVGHPHAQELYKLQADHLIAQHAHDIAHTPALKVSRKFHTLRDETVGALKQLPPERQAHLMKRMNYDLIERQHVLDPHGIITGSEQGNKPMLEELAYTIHTDYAPHLPDKGAKLGEAINGSQRNLGAAMLDRAGRPTGFSLPG